MRHVLASVWILSVLSCARSADSTLPEYAESAARVYYLLKAVGVAETAARIERRTDVIPEGDRTEGIVAVLAKGETPGISLAGGRGRLFGDAGGFEGWFVDNAVLFEVAGADGRLEHRFAVGYHDGLQIGSEEIDNVGPRAFRFDPGEVDITSALPDQEPLVIRTTALDTGFVGQVSNLFLRIEPPGSERGGDPHGQRSDSAEP